MDNSTKHLDSALAAAPRQRSKLLGRAVELAVTTAACRRGAKQPSRTTANTPRSSPHALWPKSQSPMSAPAFLLRPVYVGITYGRLTSTRLGFLVAEAARGRVTARVCPLAQLKVRTSGPGSLQPLRVRPSSSRLSILASGANGRSRELAGRQCSPAAGQRQRSVPLRRRCYRPPAAEPKIVTLCHDFWRRRCCCRPRWLSCCARRSSAWSSVAAFQRAIARLLRVRLACLRRRRASPKIVTPCDP